MQKHLKGLNRVKLKATLEETNHFTTALKNTDHIGPTAV